MKNLLNEFSKQIRHACFIQIGKRPASLLKTLGYFVFPMGLEHSIELNSIKLTWSKNKNLVRYKNKFLKRGFQFREFSMTPKLKSQCACIDKKWFSHTSSKSHNQQFLTRQHYNQEFKEVRYFGFFINDECIAYTTCDPIYKSQIIFGYSVSMQRYNLENHSGVNYAMLYHIIHQLKKENIKSLQLGFSPYSKYQPNFFTNGLTFSMFLYPFYKFQGLAKMKFSVSTFQQTTYMAVPKNKIYFLPFYWFQILHLTINKSFQSG